MPSLINLPFVHLSYKTTYQVNKKLSKAYVLIDSTGRVRPERCNGYDKIAFLDMCLGVSVFVENLIKWVDLKERFFYVFD